MKTDRTSSRLSSCVVGLACGMGLLVGCAQPESTDPQSASLIWPELTREARPWAYWWWMGSAVDTTNITRELTRYRNAGMGGVHIVPIYGAKGWEDRSIEYLTPQWLAMLRHTVAEADRLDLGVDMTTGTGWCFGGPHVSDDEANANVVWKTAEVAAGAELAEQFDPQSTQALMAFSPDGSTVDLLPRLNANGKVDWTPEDGPWRVCAVTQRPSGQQVKRASAGGEGHMLNPAYAQAMTNYLRWFETAFSNYDGPKPRAQYHDSYEYRSDWSPDFFDMFEQRRGYRLQEELPALFANAQPPRNRRQANAPKPDLGAVDADRAARVKYDYRRTYSDLMVDTTMPMWADWSRRNGFLTRNQAHGSPANWLDLYAVADIPESEMFFEDRNKLVAKFASSAAHVTGRELIGNETGTWLDEHFTVTLADLKYLLDDLFVSGINHVFYHGSCYSPDEAGWPGWLFYASTQMNPRNAIWNDASALNAYIARCQSVLQAGQPDNDLLVYWPIHDYWHRSSSMVENMTVHARSWFEEQPIGIAAEHLWERGYGFDYVSDRQLVDATSMDRETAVPGGPYQAIVIPTCAYMPLATFSELLDLAASGSTVIFEDALPGDVPGLDNLEARRAKFKALCNKLAGAEPGAEGPRQFKVGHGHVIIAPLQRALDLAGIQREPMVDHSGLWFIRRALDDGRYYFIANRSEQELDNWISLATEAQSVVMMNPLDGSSGLARIQGDSDAGLQVYLQLKPGESIILRTFSEDELVAARWPYWSSQGAAHALHGEWRVEFIQGGPEVPSEVVTESLQSWTALGGKQAESFAGTARYTTTFDAPSGEATTWQLDLGTVCQSARVRLNGEDLGTLIAPPFQLALQNVKPENNVLEVDVTNVSANRIRDLDQRGVNWRNFHDINFVNINYRPFDASDWPLTDSGLLGPVTLTPVNAADGAGSH